MLRNEPGWTYEILIGDEAVEHCRSIGAVSSADGQESLVVEVVQRDELSEDGTMISSGPAQVLVGGVRVSPESARQLAEFLSAAADLLPPGSI